MKLKESLVYGKYRSHTVALSVTVVVCLNKSMKNINIKVTNV